jgi:DNA polymerase-3 subunit alpha
LDVIDIYNKFHNAQKEEIKQIKIKDLEKYGLTEYVIEKYSGKKTVALYKELDVKGLISELCSRLDSTKKMGVITSCKFEMEYLEMCLYYNPNINENYYIITEYKHYNDVSKPYFTARNIKTGQDIKSRVKQGKLFKQNPFGCFSILEIKEFGQQFKKRNVLGKWISTDEIEPILDEWSVIK